MKLTLFTNIAFVTAFFAQGILAVDIIATRSKQDCAVIGGIGCYNAGPGTCCTNYDDGRILVWKIANGPPNTLFKVYESAFCDPNNGATYEIRSPNGCIDVGATPIFYRAAKWWTVNARLHNKDISIAEDFEKEDCERVRPDMVFLPKVGAVPNSENLAEDKDYYKMPKGGEKIVGDFLEKDDYEGLRAYLEAEKTPRLYHNE